MEEGGVVLLVGVPLLTLDHQRGLGFPRFKKSTRPNSLRPRPHPEEVPEAEEAGQEFRDSDLSRWAQTICCLVPSNWCQLLPFRFGLGGFPNQNRLQKKKNGTLFLASLLEDPAFGFVYTSPFGDQFASESSSCNRKSRDSGNLWMVASLSTALP